MARDYWPTMTIATPPSRGRRTRRRRTSLTAPTLHVVPLDAGWLRERVDAGASAADIAAEAYVSPRAVRYALHRHGIPLPSAVRHSHVDLDAVLDAYRTGEPVDEIARRTGVSPWWIKSRATRLGAERPPGRPRRKSKYGELEDRRWLLEQLAGGRTAYAIAKQLGTTRQTVNIALTVHGITPPPADADPVERLAYIDDPAIVARTADRIATEARQLAVRAANVRDDALTR